jgi:putative membrane protein
MEDMMVQWCGDMGVAEWLGMIALWAVVMGLAIWAVSRLFPTQPGSHAHAVLDQRLARGDIDLETYTAALAAIDFSDRPAPQSDPLRGA